MNSHVFLLAFLGFAFGMDFTTYRQFNNVTTLSLLNTENDGKMGFGGERNDITLEMNVFRQDSTLGFSILAKITDYDAVTPLLTFNMTLGQLIEYEEVGDEDGYTPGDTIVNAYDLTFAPFAIQYLSDEYLGGVIRQFKLSVCNSYNGSASFQANLCSHFFSFLQELPTHNPLEGDSNSINWNLNITGLTPSPSRNTNFALEFSSTFYDSLSIPFQYLPTEQAVTIGNNKRPTDIENGFGAMSWDLNYVNGAGCSELVALIPTFNGYNLYLNFLTDSSCKVEEISMTGKIGYVQLVDRILSYDGNHWGASSTLAPSLVVLLIVLVHIF